MSNFLQNLVVRTLQSTPSVKPRLASRFEAPPFVERPTSTDSFTHPIEETAEFGEATGRAAADSKANMLSRTVPDLQTAWTPPAPPPPIPRAARESEGIELTRPMSSDVHPVPPKIVKPQVAGMKSSELPAIDTPTETPPVQRVPMTRISGAVAQASQVSDRAEILEPVVRPRERPEIRFDDEPTPLPRPEKSVVIEAAAENQRVTAAPRQTEPSPSIGFQEGNWPSVPTVHVSIGRIDVRAMAPTVTGQPRSQVGAKPESSLLDGYLRERNGGR